MKGCLFFLSFIFVFVSCKKVHKSPEPDNLLSEEKMVDIMYDIRLMNAAKSKNYKKIKDSAVHIDKYIYHKYQIDSLTLRQNIDYYATNSFKTAKDIEFAVQQKLEGEKNEVARKISKLDSVKFSKGKKTKLEKKEAFKSTKE